MTQGHFLYDSIRGLNALKISKFPITIAPRKTMPISKTMDISAFNFQSVPVKTKNRYYEYSVHYDGVTC